MINRIRRLKLKGFAEIIPIKKKVERREKIREKKAEISANIEISIEQELLDRLKEGTYGEIYNYNPSVFDRVMDEREMEDHELDENDVDWPDEAFVYDPNELEDEEETLEELANQEKADAGDLEDAFGPVKTKPKGKKVNDKRKGIKLNDKDNGGAKKKKPKVEVEYEYEYEREEEQEAESH